MARKFKKRFLKRYLNMIDTSAWCVGSTMAQLCNVYAIHKDDMLYNSIRAILETRRKECLKELELNMLLTGDTGTDGLIDISGNVTFHPCKPPPIEAFYVPKQ